VASRPSPEIHSLTGSSCTDLALEDAVPEPQKPYRKRESANQRSYRATDQPTSADGIPAGLCRRCGMKTGAGPHATAADCIDALRERLARFE
jgi:hypothetical protein